MLQMTQHQKPANPAGWQSSTCASLWGMQRGTSWGVSLPPPWAGGPPSCLKLQPCCPLLSSVLWGLQWILRANHTAQVGFIHNVHVGLYMPCAAFATLCAVGPALDLNGTILHPGWFPSSTLGYTCLIAACNLLCCGICTGHRV